MRVIFCLLLACQLTLGQGEIVHTGMQYDPGTRVQFPSYGISFIVPREWKGGLAADDDVFIMASDTKPGIGLAIFKSISSPKELENYIQAVQNLGDNIILQPDGKAQIKESELTQNYSSSLYRGKAIAKTGAHGHSVIFFFAGPADQEKYYGSVAEKISSMVSFTKPDPDLVVKDWQKRLEGMVLEKSASVLDSSKIEENSSLGFNEIHFCKDSHYRLGKQLTGKWQIQVTGLETQLILLGTDQNTTVYSLGRSDHKISLNGVPFKIQKSLDCK
jgi:hypothetical protein